MKFPLLERPFASLRLHAEQARDFEQLVTTLLRDTVDEYERYVNVQQRQLDKNHWKLLKHRENLNVYRARLDRDTELALLAQSGSGSGSHLSSGSGSGPVSQSGSGSRFCVDPVLYAASPKYDWSLPKLLATGTIVGTLDDVMYGLTAPDTEAVQIRTSYLQDEILDSDLLCPIAEPTKIDPFHFVGINWAVRAHASSFSAMVWPRDTVVVEGTGIHVLPSGERIGYMVSHSVSLPQCPELHALGIVRKQLVACSLFKQLNNGAVDVYMTKYVEQSGKLPDSVVLTSAAAGMTNCWKAVWCAQNKKLAYLAAQAAVKWVRDGGGLERLVLTTNKDGQYCCGLCLKTYKMYSSVITCQVCNLMVCSRCQIGRKLSKLGSNGAVRQCPLVFCKNCIARSTKESAVAIARAENVRSSDSYRRLQTPAAMKSMQHGHSRPLSDRHRTGSHHHHTPRQQEQLHHHTDGAVSAAARAAAVRAKADLLAYKKKGVGSTAASTPQAGQGAGIPPRYKKHTSSVDTSTSSTADGDQGASLTDLGSFEASPHRSAVRGFSYSARAADEYERHRSYDFDDPEPQFESADDWDREHKSSQYLPEGASIEMEQVPPEYRRVLPRPLRSNSGGRDRRQPQATTAPPPPPGQQQQLWMQMNQLVQAAEQTYQITRQNANAMRQHDVEEILD